MANEYVHTVPTGYAGLIIEVALPNGNKYKVHDENALHDVDLISAIIFKGTDTEANILKKTGEKGDVWHAYDTGNEWLYVGTDNNYGNKDPWQELGNPLVSNHYHTVAVQGTNAPSTVTGTTTVPTVSVADIYTKASSSAPKVTAPTDTFVKSYPGTTKNLTQATITPPGGSKSIKAVTTVSSLKLDKTTLTGVAGEVEVIKTVTPKTAALEGVSISGVKGSTDASLVTKTTKKMATTSINPVGGTTSVVNSVTPTSVSSTAQNANNSNWSFTVANNCLTIGGGNGTSFAASTLPANTTVVTGVNSGSTTVATMGESVTLATGKLAASDTNGATVVDSVNITGVTVPIADTAVTLAKPITVMTGIDTTTEDVALSNDSATTLATGTASANGTGTSLVSGVSTENVSVATPGTEMSVLTGLGTAGTVGAVMTGLGTPTTASAVTDVDVAAPTITLAAGTSTDGFKTGEDVTVGSTTAAVSGTAAAQTWTQNPNPASSSGPLALS